MNTLEEQVIVDVPAQVAWEQLHRIDEYPRFVDGVLRAYSRDRNHARMAIDVGGNEHEFEAEIADRGQGKLMTWQSESPPLKGTFALQPLDEQHTQVQIRLEYDPDTVKETFGGPKLGFAQATMIERTVRDDLDHFKELVEEQAQHLGKG